MGVMILNNQEQQQGKNNENQVEIKIIGKMMSKIYEILLTKNDAKKLKELE